MLPWQQADVITYSRQMAASFEQWLGYALITAPADTLAHDLYHAPFVVVSHGTQADPVFRYANLAAQKLWGYSLEEFLATPSRLSAKPDAREERQRLLELAETCGFVDSYKGVRVAKDGRLFRIHNCVLWNVQDRENKKMPRDKIGQAATFSDWEWLS